VSLELGGKSPHLVFESADLEQGRLIFYRPISFCGKVAACLSPRPLLDKADKGTLLVKNRASIPSGSRTGTPEDAGVADVLRRCDEFDVIQTFFLCIPRCFAPEWNNGLRVEVEKRLILMRCTLRYPRVICARSKVVGCHVFGSSAKSLSPIRCPSPIVPPS